MRVSGVPQLKLTPPFGEFYSHNIVGVRGVLCLVVWVSVLGRIKKLFMNSVYNSSHNSFIHIL